MSARSSLAALACSVAASLAAAPVRADRREASLHGQLLAGVLLTGDRDGDGARTRVPLAGIAVRAGYATHDLFQYDVALAVAAAGEASFAEHTFAPAGRPPVTGPYRTRTLALRVDGGVTLRAGVRWIPTVRVAAGVQVRRLGEARVESDAGTFVGREAALALDLVGTASVGVDHRVHRRLIVGVAAGGSLAVPLGGPPAQTLEVTFHAAYYHYPRW